jgi:ribonuclease R
VGTLVTTGRFLYVVPLDPVYRQDFAVAGTAGAKAGDRVVVRFRDWPNRHVPPEGEIVDVIGPADRPSLDTDVVCRQYDLPGEFPEEALREAEGVAARLGRPGRREDLRDRLIVTVDPERARDFDDAISLERDASGRRVLGVHIADVSHFVRPRSALDDEARERATSVYLVDRVIPMLPEQISNGVCSLRPAEDRLCFSAFLTFDAGGRPAARRFARTVIRSRCRLTYEQAFDVLEGRPPAGLDSLPEGVAGLLGEVAVLARQLRQHRFQQGALDLELPECEVLLAPDGRMSGIRAVPHDESHQLIEECMVAANEAVAAELSSRGLRILSRLHEPPDPRKIEELTASLARLGFRPGDLRGPRALARFVTESASHPLHDHAHTMVLRSLKRAVYSAEASGHFGLAKRHYSHFTSPIRRYPDLVLHRQLAAHLAGEPGGGAMPIEDLKAAAAHSTDREQRADEASRALIEIKKFRFLQQQLDEKTPQVYDAVVSRVANFGMFVDVQALQFTGLVHVSAISERFVRFDRGTETLSVGNRAYRIGRKVRVFVARVDFDQRRADFALAEEGDGEIPAGAADVPPIRPTRRSGREQNRERHRERHGFAPRQQGRHRKR